MDSDLSYSSDEESGSGSFSSSSSSEGEADNEPGRKGGGGGGGGRGDGERKSAHGGGGRRRAAAEAGRAEAREGDMTILHEGDLSAEIAAAAAILNPPIDSKAWAPPTMMAGPVSVNAAASVSAHPKAPPGGSYSALNPASGGVGAGEGEPRVFLALDLSRPPDEGQVCGKLDMRPALPSNIRLHTSPYLHTSLYLQVVGFRPFPKDLAKVTPTLPPFTYPGAKAEASAPDTVDNLLMHVPEAAATVALLAPSKPPSSPSMSNGHHHVQQQQQQQQQQGPAMLSHLMQSEQRYQNPHRVPASGSTAAGGVGALATAVGDAMAAAGGNGAGHHGQQQQQQRSTPPGGGGSDQEDSPPLQPAAVPAERSPHQKAEAAATAAEGRQLFHPMQPLPPPLSTAPHRPHHHHAVKAPSSSTDEDDFFTKDTAGGAGGATTSKQQQCISLELHGELHGESIHSGLLPPLTRYCMV